MFYSGGLISYTFDEDNKEEVLEKLKENLEQVFEDMEKGYEPVELFKVKSTDTIDSVLEKIEQYILEYMTNKQNGVKDWIYNREPKIMLSFKAEISPRIIRELLNISNIAINFLFTGEGEESLFYMREVEHSGERESSEIYITHLTPILDEKLARIVEEYKMDVETPATCCLYYDEF